MSKSSKTIKMIVEIALFAAIGYILDEIQGVFAVSFTSGGSIGFAMVAVLLISYRRGPIAGVLTGLLMGLLDFSTKAYIIHPVQPLLDYILPYTLVGLAGLFKPLFNKSENNGQKVMWLIVGTVVGGLLKFISHFLAGAIFWGDAAYFAWNLNYLNPWVYSLVYNIAYIGPCIILSALVLIALFYRAPKLFIPDNKVEIKERKIDQNKLFIIIESILFITGMFLFIYFLIKYINSYKYKESSMKFSFDKDSQVILLSGLAMAGQAIYSFVKTLKGKFVIRHFYLGLALIGLLMYGYSLARVIEMYISEDNEINNYYWLWFGLTAPVTTALIAGYFIKLKSDLKANSLSKQSD